MVKNNIHRLVLSAAFLAIGLVLPTITANIREVGNMLLPMHLPVFLCAFICGWQHAAYIGAVLPLLRCLIFGMPKLYPNAVAMSVELMSYGLICGVLFLLFKKKNAISVYASLIGAMIGGRIIWSCLSALLYSLLGAPKTLAFFFTRGVVEAVPGLILQLTLIPAIVLVLQRVLKAKN